MALAGVTDQIVYLEEGDLIDLQPGRYWVISKSGERLTEQQRPVRTVMAHSGAAELGPYRHYMQKEIFEQPRALGDTLEGLKNIAPELFDGVTSEGKTGAAPGVFKEIDRVLILACGTSYYSGCTAKYWIEAIAGIPCNVEVASEYRYRTSVPDPKTLIVTISQSGETADTLAALRHAQSLGMKHSLTICNVATSAMVRECELAYITRRRGDRRGIDQGLHHAAGRPVPADAGAGPVQGTPDGREGAAMTAMRHLPVALQSVLALEPQIISWAEDFAKKENALFLGRGIHYPIALEGALKLKEISYIHAEAYPAGELKHGPLALVDSQMPVVTVAPNDALLEKLKSNMQEVRARRRALCAGRCQDQYRKRRHARSACPRTTAR
jgi:glucosamine--fructose-6-phosphate aminotransferase (isomerizing)